METTMTTETENQPACVRCGHSYHCHYNATATPNYTHGRTDTRKNRPRNRPCHKMGKHDTRCDCRDYAAAAMTPATSGLTEAQREELLDELTTAMLAASEAWQHADRAERDARDAKEYAQAARDAASRGVALLKTMKVVR